VSEYREVDWEAAECRDLYTDLFYSVEEERNASAYNNINALALGLLPVSDMEGLLDLCVRERELRRMGRINFRRTASLPTPGEVSAATAASAKGSD
jgi:hypothetical protein